MGATKDNLHPIIGYEGSASYGHTMLVCEHPKKQIPQESPKEVAAYNHVFYPDSRCLLRAPLEIRRRQELFRLPTDVVQMYLPSHTDQLSLLEITMG